MTVNTKEIRLKLKKLSEHLLGIEGLKKNIIPENLILMLADILLVNCAAFGALLLRFEFDVP